MYKILSWLTSCYKFIEVLLLRYVIVGLWGMKWMKIMSDLFSLQCNLSTKNEHVSQIHIWMSRNVKFVKNCMFSS